jgi:Spy/CpxP family protein refolding chaperone
MKIQTKFALILLAAAMSLPAAFAQAPDQEPGSDEPSGPAMHRPMPGGAWGERGERGPGRGHWGRGAGMAMRGWGQRDLMLARIVRDPALRQRLGITAEQTTKIQQETSAFRKTQIRSRADDAIKRVELMDLLSAEQPDRAAIDKKLEEIAAVRLAQAKAAVGFHLSMRDVLTPDQRQKLEQMRRGPGPRGPRRGGPRDSDEPPAAPAPPGEN